MTSVLDRPVDSDTPIASLPTPSAGVDEGVGLARLAAASYLAAAAAGWMLGGVFGVATARAIGVVAPAAGVGIIIASFRSRRPAVMQYLAVPAALALGAVAVAPNVAGRANLPHLVAQALRSGGLSQPPVAFDPGWRFLLVALAVLFGSALTAIAGGRRNPRLAVLASAAVVVVGALVQPAAAENASVIGSLVLLVAALGVSFSAAGDDGSAAGSGAFEVRRLVRGAAVVAALLVALVAVSRLGFLFPASAAHEVIPPKRPQPPLEEPDRILFTVRAERSVTWRLGVLDGYDGRSFLTPPFDTGRFVDVRSRRFSGSGVGGPTFRATFTIGDQQGHVVPAPANPSRVSSRGVAITFDPRTQQLRLPDRQAGGGVSYAVDAPVPPTAVQLAASPPPPSTVREFLRVPAPPQAVTELLGQAPASPLFARLQYVRNVFYAHVIAAGAGNPVDVPPARVAEMLAGQPASPYEITAGEVLLARWAGVPARLGYGYFGGDVQPSGAVDFRPRHGATWLEAYFEGNGWVPIVGSPPRAQSSLRRTTRREDPVARPTDELALIVYVPVRLRTVQLFYTVARYWAARGLLVAAALVGIALLVPGGAKWQRRRRRRRSARAGPDRLRVAYADVRDLATDLGIGTADLTPLEMVGEVEPDEEHRQLAWLVTRGLWGDLTRDLTEADVCGGEEMAASIARRLRRAQPLLNRMSGFASPASLRAPWDPTLANFWPRPVAGRARMVRRATVVVAVAVVAAVGVVTARSLAPGNRAPAAGSLPARIAPASLGDVVVRPEPDLDRSYQRAGPSSAVATGRVLSIRQGEEIQGSLQIGALRDDLDAGDDVVRRQVLKSIGGGRFALTRIGQARIYALDLPEQRFLLWFPPSGRYFELQVTRKAFDQGDALFAALLTYQRTGIAGARIDTAPGVPVPDPRRGIAE